MERWTHELHVLWHTVDDDEWLGIGIEGVDTIHEHGYTLSWHTAASERVDIATEVRLNLVVDGNVVVVIGSFRCAHTLCGSGRRVDVLELVAIHECTELALSTNRLLNERIAFSLESEDCGIGRYLDGVLSVLVRHGCIATVVVGSDTHTGSRHLGSCIDDGTTDFLRWHGRTRNDRLLRRSRCFFFLSESD